MTIFEELANALRRDDVSEYKRLIAAHPDELRLRDEDDGKCIDLYLAATKGSLQVLKYIISQGVGVNEIRDQSGETPLFGAAAEGHSNVVRWLLEQGATPNQVRKGVRWCSALNTAIHGGHFEVVKLLVEDGADLNAIGPGMTPLSFAVSYNKKEIADYLRSKGAKLPEELSPEERGPQKPAKGEKKKPKKT